MVAARPIPANYDELVTNYDPLVRWVIDRTAKLSRVNARGRLSPEDAEDLRQHVYTVMLHRDYLARCTAYLERKGSGSITTSLYTFVQRVAMNWFRDARVRRGYETAATADVKVVQYHRDTGESLVETDVVDTRDVYAAIEAGIMLDKIATRLPAPSREVLQACRMEGELSSHAVGKRLPHRRAKTAMRGLRRDLKETYVAAGV